MVLLQTTATSFDATAFALGAGHEPQVLAVPGATLLLAPQSSPTQAAAALNWLRGFRATGKRLVWFDTTELSQTPRACLEEWGGRLVAEGGATCVVATGPQGEAAARGARAAGVGLRDASKVVQPMTARNVLCDLISAGDVVLLLGVAREQALWIAERLEATDLS
ncbi:MAG: hypothetical protein KDA61_15540 [Planctomycetales bacterium]|nr:hypothetical protein [Planctomycetales bacterium]